jgi:cleavage stimulation factor subunit 3
MSAKGAYMALENMTRGLQRTNLPRLAPAPGFDGDHEFAEQVALWKKWIAWEKTDPLALQADEPETFKQRVLYCYKQALMAMRFWPELWVDAAEWCFEDKVVKDGRDFGLEFLTQGISANPESVLLALKHADRIEATFPVGEGDDAKVARGSAVRAPYDNVLDTLYDMSKKIKDREQNEVKKIEEMARQELALQSSIEANEDDDVNGTVVTIQQIGKDERIKTVKQAYAAQQSLISRTISFVWIALARAMRRCQGKGTPGGTLGGLRQVFTDARHKGKLTSDVYVAVALIESVVYKDPVGPKIFERGAKLFPEDANFMIEYLKYLHSKDDTTSKLYFPSSSMGG